MPSLVVDDQSKNKKDAFASAVAKGTVIEMLSDDDDETDGDEDETNKDETTTTTSKSRTPPTISNSSRVRNQQMMMVPGGQRDDVPDELSKWFSEHEADRECLVYACDRLIEEEDHERRKRERNRINGVRKEEDAPPREVTVIQKSKNRKRTDQECGNEAKKNRADDCNYYDVNLPVTFRTGSLMIDIRKLGDWIVFDGYRRFQDGSQGPAEVANLFRSIGDKIVSVNDHSVDGKTFDEVVESIRAIIKDIVSKRNSSRFVKMRLLSKSKYSAASVRALTNAEDGTVAPVTVRKKGRDGLYQRPVGRGRN